MKYIITIISLFFICCNNISCPFITPDVKYPPVSGMTFPAKCYQNWYTNYTSYKVSPNKTLSNGIKLDDTENPLTKEEIQTLTNRIEAIFSCSLNVIASMKDKSFQNDWSCTLQDKPSNQFRVKIERDCLVIKIAKASKSPCTGWYVLDNAPAPVEGCDAKGQQALVCPCKWRNVIQDDNIIITSKEGLYLWELSSLITGCRYIWSPTFPTKACIML